MIKDFFGIFNSGKDLTEEEMLEMVSDVDQLLKNSDFENAFSSALEEALSQPMGEDEIYDELMQNYFFLLNLLDIYDFKKFRFISYEDCRKISIDNKEYDFNDCFEHDDAEAEEAMCAIDCLIADLQTETDTPVLNKLEKLINENI